MNNMGGGYYDPNYYYGMNSGNMMGYNQNQQNMSYSRPPIPGKIIRSEEEITVQDVPTDGSAGVFPLADYSAIIVKYWTKEGYIKPVKFVPETPNVLDNKTGEAQSVDLTPLMERMDKLEQMIKKMTRPYKPPYKPKQKEDANHG